MTATALILILTLVVLVLAVAPRVAAWFRGNDPREGLLSEVEALERKKEMLRRAQQPPAA